MANTTRAAKAERSAKIEERRRKRRLFWANSEAIDISHYVYLGGELDEREEPTLDVEAIEREYLNPDALLVRVVKAIVVASPPTQRKLSVDGRVDKAMWALRAIEPKRRGPKERSADEAILIAVARSLFEDELGFSDRPRSLRKLIRATLEERRETVTNDRIRALSDKLKKDRDKYMYLASVMPDLEREISKRVDPVLDALRALGIPIGGQSKK
jgi:hypothetical protein